MVRPTFESVSGVVIEEQVVTDLVGAIAQALRTEQGKTVVVCEQPLVLLSLVRKRWLRVIRRLMSKQIFAKREEDCSIGQYPTL